MNEATQKTQNLPLTGVETSDFTALLQKEFRPQTERARQDVESAVLTLASEALATSTVVSQDAVESVQAIIAEIDRKLSEQINLILHHEEFQKLEGSWRGLQYLVSNTETDSMLKVRVLNIPKKELHRTLKRFKGVTWDQSPIFKKLYEEEYGQLGGEPFGCVVADYYFDHGPTDVETLTELGKTAAAAHAPVLTSASPTLFQMETWQELGNPRDVANIFTTPEYAGWRSLRESEDSRYLGLALPRFLARRPYGAKSDPVDEFEVEEDASGPDIRK
jgi:type VI secretion system protein ImpC